VGFAPESAAGMHAQPSGLLVQLILYRPEKNPLSECAGVTHANDVKTTDTADNFMKFLMVSLSR